MHLQIDSSICERVGARTEREKKADKRKVSFIVKSKFRKRTGRRFLGYAWIMLDPLIIALIYLFVFTVVRARVGASSILIGVTMYGILQSSIMEGVNSLSKNGGLACERVSTFVLLQASIWYRVIDIQLQSTLIAIILIAAFDCTLFGGIIFLILGQIMGMLFFGFGVLISPIPKRIPDFETIIKYILRIGFYASPAMYPMVKMTGLHYRIMEYNPFSYFVEYARYLAGSDSVFLSLDKAIFVFFITLLTLMMVIGLKRVDRLRWRMTTWS
jgi:ABC-2 type transport system permease protein